MDDIQTEDTLFQVFAPTGDDQIEVFTIQAAYQEVSPDLKIEALELLEKWVVQELMKVREL